MNLVEKWLSLNRDGDAFVTFLEEGGIESANDRSDIRDQISEWCAKWEVECKELEQVIWNHAYSVLYQSSMHGLEFSLVVAYM